jgi:glycosyltransferase involved in cell wall biosynthesis
LLFRSIGITECNGGQIETMKLTNYDRRLKAKAWLRDESVNNQGRLRSENIAPYTKEGLLFRSKPEINLYYAIKGCGNTFARIMHICAVIKYPPIEGGVSARCYWLARSLAARGHQVSVVTNATEVEFPYRVWIPPEDEDRLEASFSNGGQVRVVATGSFQRNLAHIPKSNPFVTKLAALATEEIRAAGADLVFSWYFEPYSISASLAAIWTGIPHIVHHAGSDRTRLMSHPELSIAYREMLRHASMVMTGGHVLCGLGLDTNQVAAAHVSFLPDEWVSSTQRLDVNSLIKRVSAIQHPAVTNTRPIPQDEPVFGIYGKVGETKGTFDLIHALGELRRRNRRFAFLTLTGGLTWPGLCEALKAEGLSEVTWSLPFLPHWRVPEFLRACTAVCFLERRFPISIHAPGIPQEILASGTCAVLSREIADKQRFRDRFRSGENVFIVDDPADTRALVAVLEQVISNPELAHLIGKAGSELIRVQNGDALAQSYETVFAMAIDRHRQQHSKVSNAQKDGDPQKAVVMEFLNTHMPASMVILRDHIPNWVTAFQENSNGSEMTPALNAYRLSEIILSKARTLPGTPEYLPDLVEYEHLSLWLTVDLESATGIPAFPRFRPGNLNSDRFINPDLSILERRPLRSNWLRCREFGFDVPELQAGIGQGLLDKAPQHKKQIYLFQKRGDLDKRIFHISAQTKALIELSDGTRTVSELGNTLGLRDSESRTRLRNQVLELTKELVVQLL